MRLSRPIRLILLALLSILLFSGLNMLFVALRLGPLWRFMSFMGRASRLSADAAGKEFLPLSDSLTAWEDLVIWPFALSLVAVLYVRLIHGVRLWDYLLLAVPAALIVGWLNPLRTLIAFLGYSACLAVISWFILRAWDYLHAHQCRG